MEGNGAVALCTFFYKPGSVFSSVSPRFTNPSDIFQSIFPNREADLPEEFLDRN
jgi:hypothetical protein